MGFLLRIVGLDFADRWHIMPHSGKQDKADDEH